MEIDRIRRLVVLAASFSVCVLVAMPCHAQVATNITPTTDAGDLGTTVTPNGMTHTITGGTRPDNGPNLFHSFDQFSVGTNATANFNNESGLTTENILSRVTGDTRSDIDGTIRTTGFAGADLFLINPAGVMFGPGARLDLQGSFHVSTADSIKLADGVQFNAMPSANNAATLTTAPPEAFGFLGEDAPVQITLNKSELRNSGKRLSFIGGDFTLSGGEIDAAGGRIDVVSVASAGDVPVEEMEMPKLQRFDRMGQINVTGSELRAGGGTGDTGIFISGGSFTMKNQGKIEASGRFSGNAGRIDIKTTNLVSITDGSELRSDSLGISGNPGRIDVSTSNFELIDSEVAANSLLSSSGGGAIEVTAKDKIKLERAKLNAFSNDPASDTGGIARINLSAENTIAVGDRSSINAQTRGERPGGDVSISASRLDIEGQSNVVTSTATGDGDAGQILLEADNLSLRGKSTLRSITNGRGRAGRIQISGNTLNIEDAQVSTDTLRQGKNDAGEINIKVKTLTVESGGSMSSSTIGEGTAGLISIGADEVKLDDGEISTNTDSEKAAGEIRFQRVGQLTINNGSSINSTTSSSGDAGNISFTGTGSERVDLQKGAITTSTAGAGGAGRIQFDNIAEIIVAKGGTIDSTTTGDGNAGQVSVLSRDIRVKGQVSTSTTGAKDAGEIFLHGRSVRVSDSGLVVSSTEGAGQGGLISINADEDITIANGGRISASTSNIGQGGNIRIRTKQLELRNGGAISAVSTGNKIDRKRNEGKSGTININVADTFRIFDNSRVSVETAQADAGNINIDTEFLLHLRNQGEISTSAAVLDGIGTGNGGDVNIDPVFVILDGRSKIVAQALKGSGGSIDIETDFLFKSPDSEIDASSKEGIDGTVVISSPDTDVIAGTLTLPESFLNVSTLLGSRCAARAAKESSSFIVGGRRGVPPSPNVILPHYSAEHNQKESSAETNVPTHHSTSSGITLPFTESLGSCN